jgi:hypothetical protein
MGKWLNRAVENGKMAKQSRVLTEANLVKND